MAALSVEHLKVMAALTVEPAYASSSIYLLGGGAFGRAPKGDGGLISRACLRILSMAALSVEHLKVGKVSKKSMAARGSSVRYLTLTI